MADTVVLHIEAFKLRSCEQVSIFSDDSLWNAHSGKQLFFKKLIALVAVVVDNLGTICEQHVTLE